MKTKFITLVCLSLAAGLAHAELVVKSKATRTPLVELYTSEGCSSCPPADDFLRELGTKLREGFHALPLAFHVDYWNYLGWEDPFSKKKFTAHQREVAANNKQRSIYTPEFIVDGREMRGGNKIVGAITGANKQKAVAQIVLHVAKENDAVVANISIDNQSTSRAQVFLTVFERDITREIRGGENRGRTLQHDFVVRHWSAPMRLVRGKNKLQRLIKIPNDWNKNNLEMAVVVLKQNGGGTVQSVQTPLADLFAG